MNRRELLGVLAAAVAGPAPGWLSADGLFARGRTAHRRARGRAFQVFDPHQAETVAAMAEMIIPETDTPGARAAQVPEFMDLLVAESASDEERASFLRGLGDVDTRSRDAFGVEFVAATEAQRVAILAGLDAEVQALRQAREKAEEHFFQRLKWLTVYGYCTSEIGATAGLRYETLPGSYDGCAEVRASRAAPGDF